MSKRARAALSWLLAVAGLIAIAWIVRETGVERLAAAVLRLLPWLPLVMLLEGARWLADAWTTWLLYHPAPSATRATKRRLVAATLAAYPVILLLPAGRLGGEVLKAAAMRRAVGLRRAAAAAVTMQALPLLAGAGVSLPCVVAALTVWGATWLTGAIALQTVTAVGLGGAILWGGRHRAVGRWVGRVSDRLGAATEDVQHELTRGPAVPRAAFGAAVVSRSLLAVQILLLAQAVAVPRGVVGGLLTVGLHFVGKAAGDVVPAQLGVTDGALVLGADALGATASGLVAAALAFHASQLVWAALGALTGPRLLRR